MLLNAPSPAMGQLCLYLLTCSQAPGSISQHQRFVRAAVESRRKPLQRHLLPWRPSSAAQPGSGAGGTHLAMASSRSRMACRSRSLASLSSAAPRSRSRSSFSVVISTLSSVTCGQREAVKPRAARENAHQVCVGGEPRGPSCRLSCVG